MLTPLLLALALSHPPVAEEGVACPAPIEAVARNVLVDEEWTETLLLDVTGDGQPEVFIADHERRGNAGAPWQVFATDPAGGYELLGEVFFHRLGFKLKQRTLKTYWRLSCCSGTFITYRFTDEGIEELESIFLESNEPEYDERWEELAAWRESALRAGLFARRSTAGDSSEAGIICRPFDP